MRFIYHISFSASYCSEFLCYCDSLSNTGCISRVLFYWSLLWWLDHSSTSGESSISTYFHAWMYYMTFKCVLCLNDLPNIIIIQHLLDVSHVLTTVYLEIQKTPFLCTIGMVLCVNILLMINNYKGISNHGSMVGRLTCWSAVSSCLFSGTWLLYYRFLDCQ
jgi:hypothetical protein